MDEHEDDPTFLVMLSITTESAAEAGEVVETLTPLLVGHALDRRSVSLSVHGRDVDEHLDIEL